MNGFEDVSATKPSKIWDHWLYNKTTGMAKCNVCGKVIKATAGNSKGLKEHSRTQHKIVVEKVDLSKEVLPPSKKTRIDRYFLPEKMSIETKISRLCSLTCLSFRVLSTDPDIRASLKAEGYPLPRGNSEIQKLVYRKYDQVTDEMKAALNKLRNENARFTITTDEYTSGRNRRYINVNIHVQGDFFSLGVPRAYGTMPATRQIEILTERLSNFDVQFHRDIIAITTDGAKVMKKMGKLLKRDNEVEQVICNAHTIHLAVCDVFYKKPKDDNDDNQESERDENENEASDAEKMMTMMMALSESVELNPQYKEIIGRVRKVCKMFKRSPVKNDDGLQTYVVKAEGKEKNLVLDCKTRWNSTVDMLRRFFELRKHVEHALIDMDKRFDFTDSEIKLIHDIIESLEPLKFAVKKLCRRDATLVKAERILELTMETLASLDTEVGNEVYDAFVNRVKDRRNSEIIHVMEYLSNPDFVKTCKTDSFGAKVDAKKIKDKIITLIKRLYPESFSNYTESSGVQSDRMDDDQEESKTLEEKFNAIFDKDTDDHRGTPIDVNKALKHEFSAFEMSKKRSESLERLYLALSSIPATSVESERAFSAVGLFVTKLRSNLGDRSIDSLLTLRSHFKREERLKKEQKE